MFNQGMFRTLEESNAYMADEFRKAREEGTVFAKEDFAKEDVPPKVESEQLWRVWLDLQGLNELRETAKKVFTKVSGTKQDVRDAILTKFAVYEDMYTTMSKHEHRMTPFIFCPRIECGGWATCRPLDNSNQTTSRFARLFSPDILKYL